VIPLRVWSTSWNETQHSRREVVPLAVEVHGEHTFQNIELLVRIRVAMKLRQESGKLAEVAEEECLFGLLPRDQKSCFTPSHHAVHHCLLRSNDSNGGVRWFG
jgi:hypothetical protein